MSRRAAVRPTPDEPREDRAPASGVRRVVCAADADPAADLPGAASPPEPRLLRAHAAEALDRLVGVDGAPWSEASLAGILRTFARGGLRGS